MLGELPPENPPPPHPEYLPLEDCSPEKIKHGEGNGNIQMRNCYYTTFTEHNAFFQKDFSRMQTIWIYI